MLIKNCIFGYMELDNTIKIRFNFKMNLIAKIVFGKCSILTTLLNKIYKVLPTYFLLRKFL